MNEIHDAEVKFKFSLSSCQYDVFNLCISTKTFCVWLKLYWYNVLCLIIMSWIHVVAVVFTSILQSVEIIWSCLSSRSWSTVQAYMFSMYIEKIEVKCNIRKAALQNINDLAQFIWTFKSTVFAIITLTRFLKMIKIILIFNMKMNNNNNNKFIHSCDID